MQQQISVRKTVSGGWAWDNSYSRLPEIFFSRQQPAPVADPEMLLFNAGLAAELGLDAGELERPEAAAFFAGNRLPRGAEPIAQAYSGHQFGHFTTLGDGRAVLLGEHVTPDGKRFDIQLKGSGRTPYSRGGDGRAAVAPMLREYLISEAMHALGIATTRSLAVVSTGEPVFRPNVRPGAILTRVAASHIRVGTFSHFAACGNNEAIGVLLHYTLGRHFPDLAVSESPALTLLRATTECQAVLVAKWYAVGFIHGVMNTDNMALSGETIDYGPCAFMNGYAPDTVYSSIDRHGRYAYGKQATIAQWNLARLAEALVPVMGERTEAAIESAKDVLEGFVPSFQRHWLGCMRAKLGLFGEEEGDQAIVASLLKWMEARGVDFTNTFRDLTDASPRAVPQITDESFRPWHESWLQRLARQKQGAGEVGQRMRSANPAVIPRNHRVEEALQAAEREGDLSLFEQLHRVLSQPYERSPRSEPYRAPPAEGEDVAATFCGT